MNDFLKNLRATHRASHPRHPSQTRKTESQFFPKTERRKLPDRRSAPPQSSGADAAVLIETLNETLPYVRENIGQIASCMERIAETRENVAKASIEQHEAISEFFRNLSTLLTQTFIPIIESAQKTGTHASVTGNNGENILSKEEVISKIRSMRNNRATFAEIADHLKEQGIPTFSGRGDWHAQTIHRLCK